MSLSSALSNALSGLTASARGASVISSNLSNIMTEGYGVRDLSLSARSTGGAGGVTVNRVTRRADMALIGERRLADAEQAKSDVQGQYMERIDVLIGDPTKPSSLTGLLSKFEADLIAAASLPESETRLETVVFSAKRLGDTLNAIGSGLQNLRAEADRAIHQRLQSLNEKLQQIDTLNRDIMAAGSQHRETASLLDQRQALVDDVAKIVPVKELSRDLGAVALMTPDGVMLVDSHASEFQFDPRNSVTASMTIENGLLSGVRLNGSDVTLMGGELGGLFALRDQVLPAIQSKTDAVALDLVDRFSSGMDPGPAVSTPGLFTDEGGVVTDGIGLAGRLRINGGVDPDQNGAAWRLRAGFEAANPGSVGDATRLHNMIDALNAVTIPGSDVLGTQSRNAAICVSDFMSSVASQTNEIERMMAFNAVRQSELSEMEHAQGVDSDAELQKLLLVEQVYAANAKLIQAVDEMLEQLMEIA